MPDSASEDLPGGVERTSCLVVSCAECYEHPSMADGIPHYLDLKTLMDSEVSSCKGSLIDCQDRGPSFHQSDDGRILCLSCAHTADCEAGEHYGPFDASTGDRICEHCEDSAPLERIRGL